MASTLPPAKVLLLAVHFAAHADVDSLAALTKANTSLIHEDTLLRIILTHLPETVQPTAYVSFLQEVAEQRFIERLFSGLDTSPVDSLDDAEAAKKATKLHLLPLSCPDAPETVQGDALSRFLFLRTHQMDDETGMVGQLLELLLPFVHRNPGMHKWTASTVLPYVRQSSKYLFGAAPEYSLLAFEKLPDYQAIDFLLSPIGPPGQSRENVDHVLRSVVGPWIYDKDRWDELSKGTSSKDSVSDSSRVFCLGWQKVREWLLSQATLSWPVAIQAIEGWGGPEDVIFGHEITLDLPDPYMCYLRETYAATILACMYTVQEATLECLARLHAISAKLRLYLGHDQSTVHLEETMLALPDLSITDLSSFRGDRIASYMRNDLLERNNPLTEPNKESTRLILALVLSAYIMTTFGSPSSVRRVGDITFLRDERDQKSEVLKLLRAIASQSSNENDGYLLRARSSLLWLRDWGQATHSIPTIGIATTTSGTLGMVSREYVETEFLKLLLSNGRYTLARTLYEDTRTKPLPTDVVQESVYQSALDAFDNATNPNRTRGGLKRCDEIIHALPCTVNQSLPGTKRINALLKATHALSDYRLVLKQGEPFSPVVLRVHSDPVSIIGKVLEQNARAYTRLQEFLEMGMNMARAGLPSHSKLNSSKESKEVWELNTTIDIAERRITAMCIEAAIKEDDFETAFSYVASRLGTQSLDDSDISSRRVIDEWSWKAALLAGQYIRTERSQQPTHLGTASGNLEIRHLEQRIECLATALRVAPTNQLQEILKSFRRCEEQLNSAIKEEAANEAAWDAEARRGTVPGAFNYAAAEQQYPTRNMTASAAARQTEEAPMSLFDLSRATARAAQRNFTAMPSFQSTATAEVSNNSDHEEEPHTRVRKRDQLRDAATGTLVSGVGWLIGANVTQPTDDGV